MNRIYAVVLLCYGDESNVDPIVLKRALSDICHATVLDPTELSKIIPKAVEHIKTGSENKYSPEELAVSYIGEKFKDTLTGQKKNLLDFISELSTCTTIAKWQNNDESLLNALEILRQKETLHIDKTIRVKYGITDTVLKEILKIANRYV